MWKKLVKLCAVFGIYSCVQIPDAPIYYVDFKLNFCEMACYDYNEGQVIDDSKCGDDFKGGQYPIEACDQITGPHIKFFSEELKPGYEHNKKECDLD